MRMETLSFLYRLLSATSPQAFHPHVSVLLPPVIQAVGDNFYKITSEALLVTQQMVKVMRPFGEIPPITYSKLFEVILSSKNIY
jgi:cullin-associated NEDD8-dissociated protein 1